MPDVMMTGPSVILKLHESILKEVELNEQLTIGRKTSNDLVIEDQAVSGRHAKIVKIQAVYFLEDLKSTNGTFVNGTRIERKQLKDTDVITIGTHRLVFRDDAASVSTPPPASFADSDRTMLVGGSSASGRIDSRRQAPAVQILSGRTDRKEYTLTRQLSVIGADQEAAIRLTGWFAPKTAAMIGRRGEGFFVAAAEGAKAVKVNEEPIVGEAELKDGDRIDIAGVKMYFCLEGPVKS